MKTLKKKILSGAIVSCMLLSTTGAYPFGFFKKEVTQPVTLFSKLSKFFGVIPKIEPKNGTPWGKIAAFASVALLSLYLFDRIFGQKNLSGTSNEKEEFESYILKEKSSKTKRDIEFIQLPTARQSSAECGICALKNSEYLQQFFACKKDDKKEQKLADIRSDKKAFAYLQNFKKYCSGETNWLRSDDLEKAIKAKNLNGIYVIDEIAQFNVMNEAQGCNNPIFIVNTAQTQYRDSLQEAGEKKAHYYVVAVRKKEKKCYIIDSLNIDRINNEDYLEKNQLLYAIVNGS